MVAEIDYDRLLAAAAKRLLGKDRMEAALALADSSIVRLQPESYSPDQVEVHIETSDSGFDVLTSAELNERDEYTEAGYDGWVPSILERTFSAVLPTDLSCSRVKFAIRNDPVAEGWRESLKASLEGDQPADLEVARRPAQIVVEDGLRYRNQAQIALANELKKRDVMFVPLPTVVLNGGVLHREPDFVVFHRGSAAVLELYGPESEGVLDPKRRDFKGLPFELAGLRYLPVDAETARRTPGVVVDQLIALIESPR